jgi:hypothetical protein
MKLRPDFDLRNSDRIGTDEVVAVMGAVLHANPVSTHCRMRRPDTRGSSAEAARRGSDQCVHSHELHSDKWRPVK